MSNDEWLDRHQDSMHSAIASAVATVIKEKPAAPLARIAQKLMELSAKEESTTPEEQIEALRAALQQLNRYAAALAQSKSDTSAGNADDDGVLSSEGFTSDDGGPEVERSNKSRRRKTVRWRFSRMGKQTDTRAWRLSR